ncbi:recombinase family protein [Actinomadura rugatobispora]|uniref:Recombinase family protein n=1 Tax=Actinomadura rugatobispora TaxID=1994 RepID=A0ABW1AGK7_9ACTN|nr:hypothetical protein GCM10010200_025280 [Actinomadura rugatobispora]
MHLGFRPSSLRWGQRTGWAAQAFEEAWVDFVHRATPRQLQALGFPPGTARFGYARCSTDEQDVVVQTEQLLALGDPVDRIYIDRGFSGTTRRNRGGLDQALAAVWPDSVFTVTKFDRFARNMAEANQILTDLSDREVLFGLGGSVHDWNDPFGRLSCRPWRWSPSSRRT